MKSQRIVSLLAGLALASTLSAPPALALPQDTGSALAERADLDKALSIADAQARIASLEQFIKDHPGSAFLDQATEALVRSHATLGELALKARDPKAAAAAFAGALAAAPAKISDRLFSQVIWQMPVVMAAAGYRFDGIQLMRSFEKRFEAEPQRLIQIGYFYVSIESPRDAVRILERATELAPADHRAWNSLGTAYVISLRIDDAANAFAKAIELDPKEEYAYASLANMRRATGNVPEAIDLYKKQLEIKPEDPAALGGLTVAYLMNDDEASASTALGKALAIAPGDFRLYAQLAYFYVSRGRVDKAREAVELALKYEPRFSWSHITLGNILLAERRYKEAVEAFGRAQNYGDFPTLHFELGKAYMVTDQYDLALDEFKSAFDVSDDGQFETSLGDVLGLRTRKLDTLLERERQAVLFLADQPTTATQYRLAEALARIGHYVESVPDPAPSPVAESSGAGMLFGLPVAGFALAPGGQLPLPSTKRAEPKEEPPAPDTERAAPDASPQDSPEATTETPVSTQEPAAEPQTRARTVTRRAPAEAPREAVVIADEKATPGDAPLVFRPRTVGDLHAEAETAAAPAETAPATDSPVPAPETAAPNASTAAPERSATEPAAAEAASAEPERSATEPATPEHAAAEPAAPEVASRPDESEPAPPGPASETAAETPAAPAEPARAGTADRTAPAEDAPAPAAERGEVPATENVGAAPAEPAPSATTEASAPSPGETPAPSAAPTENAATEKPAPSPEEPAERVPAAVEAAVADHPELVKDSRPRAEEPAPAETERAAEPAAEPAATPAEPAPATETADRKLPEEPPPAAETPAETARPAETPAAPEPATAAETPRIASEPAAPAAERPAESRSPEPAVTAETTAPAETAPSTAAETPATVSPFAPTGGAPTGGPPPRPAEPVAEPTPAEAAAAQTPAPAPVPVRPPAPKLDPAVLDKLGEAIGQFVGVDDGREPFRKLWVAGKLAEKGVLLDRAETLAGEALDAASTATEAERSVRDLPDLDRGARLVVFTARAQSTLGWVLYKRGQRKEALAHLSKGAEAGQNDPDYRSRVWRLAVATQDEGDEKGALDLYIKAYDPSAPTARLRKGQIETLYRKVNGSLDGLEQKLQK